MDPALVLSYSLHSLMKEAIPFNAQSLGFGKDLTECYCVNGAINGLSCVSSIVYHMKYKVFNVRLWNPATRLISAASPPLFVKRECASIVKFGLGYDDSTNTYKVVANIIDPRQWKNELRIYSRAGDTCWRTVSTSPDLLLSWEEGQFVSNTFNWLAVCPRGPIDRQRIELFEYTYDDYVIFSLHVGKETHKLLRMPVDLDRSKRQEPKLVVLRDHLCVFHDFKGTHVVVSQLEEFGVEDSWTIIMKFSYISLQIDACSCSFGDYSQFNMSEDGNYLLIYNERDSILLVYDQRVKEVSKCINLCNNNHRWVGVNGYVQSLVSPQ
ncbi:F-box/kelch-repeat protein At3g23880-like [Arachis duranensis]|uniref:F-box/kelch-repeat protein At3g23880-like n=2 Tax=Arachis TaxID=3817 RepID=A0A6P4BMA3_ARADU|nr:F-box/kelch-repeat protein At3g23880-like [Arachis duranensis]